MGKMLLTMNKLSQWKGSQALENEKCDSSVQPYVAFASPCSEIFHYETAFPSEEGTHDQLGNP